MAFSVTKNGIQNDQYAQKIIHHYQPTNIFALNELSFKIAQDLPKRHYTVL
jgi:ribonucleotide reductase beta subunit family protein with ferritin-like domain